MSKKKPIYDYSSYVDQCLVKLVHQKVKAILAGKDIIREDPYA